jgi:5,10-methylenetetrahydrofolate reductase
VPGFQLVCEIEPATRPDLMRVRHQIGVLSRVATAFLIPDNHLGRATVSSIAVAHEVALMGGSAIACLNARDRNVLGFQRDLLTAAAYGVRDLLLVYGDRPETGSRSDDLTVRRMLDEARAFAERQGVALRVGVTTRLGPLPAWKQEADELFAQVSFDAEALVRWRSTITFDGPVHAGVIVLASEAMARRLGEQSAQLRVPEPLLDRLAADATAGVDHACELLAQLREDGTFEGAHLVPVGRYREVAARLERATR